MAALCVVCALAVGVLRAFGRRREGGVLKVVARLSLEPRRSLYVVEAAGRHLLVGVGDGPMAVLAELDAEAVEKALGAQARAVPVRDAFQQALRRLGGR